MRPAALLTALALTAFAGAAVAAPTVDVAIGPKLQKKANTYGVREFDYLSRDLQRSVIRAAGDGLDGARVNLVIADAKPNRPTFKELGDRIGLSPQSLGIGGATIEGSVTYPDGRILPVSYSWYNFDLRDAVGSTTWTGAERAFDRAAHKVARDAVAVTR